MNAYQRLRARFACFCAVGTGCIVTILVIGICLYSTNQIEYQAEKAFLNECHSIFHSLGARENVTPELLRYMEENHNLQIELEPSQAGAKSGLNPNEFLMRSEKGDYRVCVAKLLVGGEWAHATIARERSDEYAQCAKLRLAAGFGILAATALLAFTSWFYSAWAVRPITDDYHNQNEFLFSIAHELRTPLSVIQMNAENISKAPVDEAGQFVRIIVRECKRLGRLTGDLLDLTHTLQTGWSMQLSPQNPTYILLTAYENYELAAKEKGIGLRVIIPECQLPPIECDLARIQQVLAVLLDNALEYTPPGGQIILQVEQQRKYLAFIVSDNGPGIPNDKRSKIFEKYYRGGASGTERSHYGLGLYIAMEFVFLHHGELLVEESTLGGAKFTARIPAKNPR